MIAGIVALHRSMRAIVYSATGDSSVLALSEREPSEPGPGEVRVRVAVSGVNPTDWKARASAAPMHFAEVVPNQDGAGVIDAVGADVTGLEVGDRVWLFLAAHQRPTGTAQEFTVVPASRAVRLPDGIDFDVAASLGVPAMTAHRALTVHEFGPARLSPVPSQTEWCSCRVGQAPWGTPPFSSPYGRAPPSSPPSAARKRLILRGQPGPTTCSSIPTTTWQPDPGGRPARSRPHRRGLARPERLARCRGARQPRQHRVLREQQRR